MMATKSMLGYRGGVLDLLDKYDSSNIRLKELLSDIAKTPNDLNQSFINVVNFHATKLVKSWRDVVSYLAYDSSCADDELIANVATLWFGYDEDRVSFLNKLCPEAELEVIGDGSPVNTRGIVLGIHQSIAEDEEIEHKDKHDKFIEFVTEVYGESMIADMNHFIAALQATTPQENNTVEAEPDRIEAMKTLLRRMGGHAAQAATIAAGVALGIAAGSWLNRKK